MLDVAAAVFVGAVIALATLAIAALVALLLVVAGDDRTPEEDWELHKRL